MDPGDGIDQDEWIDVGRIGKTFGIRGEVVVHYFGETSDRFRAGMTVHMVTPAGHRPLEVAGARQMPRKLVVHFAGWQQPEDAQVWVNSMLQVRAAELEPLGEDAAYHFELIGMQVFAADGSFVGVLEEILSTPANDVYCVRRPGHEVLIPAIRDAIAEVDRESGRMILTDLKGMLEP